MSETAPKFLKSNVIIEPLVDRFYAWMHNVAPVQASMNLAFTQMPLLESYLQSPEVHMAASANPELRGGYFVNIEEARASEVAALVDSIKRDRAEMLDFAAGIVGAEDLIGRNATGSELTPLYPKLPPVLDGLVEMVYDVGNQASLRFLEPLVYRSPAYDERRQSVQVSLDDGTERPFILSTPRLPGPGLLDLAVPFRHPGLLELVGARIQPTTAGRLREVLELDDAQAALLNTMLTDRSRLAADRHIDRGGRARYFGHACLVLQSPEAAVVTDPFISTYAAGDRFTLDDLPDHIDLVLITHGHQDHLVLESLLQLRGRVDQVVVPRSSRGNLADPSMALCLRALGLPVIEVDDFEEVPFPGGSVIATPFLGGHADLDIRGKSTYTVRINGASIFVGADSSGIDPALYRYTRREVGKVDMAFLSMGCDGAPLSSLYQCLLTKSISTRMGASRKLSASNAAQAAAMITELDADEAYVYAMGDEAWLGHVKATGTTPDTCRLKQIADFLGWCDDNGITAGHLLNRREWRW
jgi:L-ascorbate metabolism protein UlaG (beta-lactamase superfamily)